MFLKLLKSKWVLGAIFALFCIFSPITLKASLTDFDGEWQGRFCRFFTFCSCIWAIGSWAKCDFRSGHKWQRSILEIF